MTWKCRAYTARSDTRINRNMIYDLSNPYQLDEFRQAVESVIADKAAVELKRKRPRRSLAQNAYLHVIIGYFATQYGCGEDQAKVDFFKRAANAPLFERETVGHGGRKVKYLRSSAELDTAEMTTAIDRFRNWSAAEAGIYLPDANEEKFLMHAEREIEKFKEYI